MAEKLTDEQLRKELIRLGEIKIGPITSTTRSIYTKKLNHLKARERLSSKSPANQTIGRKLFGFSSDESEGEGERDAGSATSRTRPGGRQSAGRSRPARTATRSSNASKSSRTSNSHKQSAREESPLNYVANSGASSGTPVKSEINKGAEFSRGVRARDPLARPSLRNTDRQSNNFNYEKPDTVEDKSEFSYQNPSTSVRSRSTAYSSSLAEKSFGADASLLRMKPGQQSFGSEHDLGEIPDSDAFESSDSDFDLTDASGLTPPEMVTRGINTSAALDDTYASSFTSNRSLDDRSYLANSLSDAGYQSRKNQLTNHRKSIGSNVQHNHSGINVLSTKSPVREEENLKKHGFKVHDEPADGFKMKQHISMFLVVFFVLFFILLGVMYWNMREIHTLDDTEINRKLCEKEQSEDCYKEEEVSNAVPLVFTLATLLGDRAGAVECGYTNEPKEMAPKELMSQLQQEHGFDQGTGFDRNFNVALDLILENPHWMLRLLDARKKPVKDLNRVSFLDSSVGERPLLCRLHRAILKVVSTLLWLIIAAVAVSAAIGLVRYRYRKQEEERKEVYDLVEKILFKLKSHHEACESNKDEEEEPYLAIPHVRDMLIPPKERKKKQKVWDKAVKFLSANESRVRVEIQTIHGEEFAVWRWLQNWSNEKKRWQGQAFGRSTESYSTSPRYSSPCLKIRNMFDLDVEYGDSWHVTVQDAILEKCGADVHILHIAVDKTSKEGCVYVKCTSAEDARQAYKCLHGWWFDGNLVTVRYLRLQRYHERFPEADNVQENLSPSNNLKLSMSQPYHQSIIESS